MRILVVNPNTTARIRLVEGSTALILRTSKRGPYAFPRFKSSRRA